MVCTYKKTCILTEAVFQRCSVKKVFLEISQNSQENTCVRVSFLIKLQVSGNLSKPLYSESDALQPFKPHAFIKYLESFKSLVNSLVVHKISKEGGRFRPLFKKALRTSRASRVKEVRRVFSLTDMECFKDDQRMPIHLRKKPDMKEIFNACTGGVNDLMICKKRPLRVKENAALIFDQNTCRIRHPFDLQTDNIAGSFKRSDKVRFY